MISIENRRRALKERKDNLLAEIHALEDQLQIRRRWQPEDREYKATLQYIATRRYQKALGKLQRLVVQRLFELHKLNLSGTGAYRLDLESKSDDIMTFPTAYRVRTYMAKNLQRRCRAIRAAVKAYNAAAKALDPPRPPLAWEKVSHFSFLEEFTLLEDTRNDIRGKPWAQPLVREAMRNARKVRRAKEELEKVQTQARRLHTSIHDEEAVFDRVLADLQSGDDPLFGAVSDYCTCRRGVNASLMARLNRLYSLPGYAGNTTPGVYAGPPREVFKSPGVSVPAPGNSATFQKLVEEETIADHLDDGIAATDMDEDEHGAVSSLVDHIADLALVMST